MKKGLKAQPTNGKLISTGRIQLKPTEPMKIEQQTEVSTYKQIVYDFQQRNHRLIAIVSRLEGVVAELTGEQLVKTCTDVAEPRPINNPISGELKDTGGYIDYNINELFTLVEFLEKHIL